MGTDYRSFNDRKDLAWWDLGDRDWTLVVERFGGGHRGFGDNKKRSLRVWFKGAEKPMFVNATNGKIIASMYGRIVEDWIGKPITIYPDPSVMFGATQTGGIRVRPTKPKGKGETFVAAQVSPEKEREHMERIERAVNEAAEGGAPYDPEKNGNGPEGSHGA